MDERSDIDLQAIVDDGGVGGVVAEAERAFAGLGPFDARYEPLRHDFGWRYLDRDRVNLPAPWPLTGGACTRMLGGWVARGVALRWHRRTRCAGAAARC